MKELLSGKLNIILEDKDDSVTMTWLGESRDVNPSAILDPYLTEFIDSIKKTPNKKVLVDYSKLHSMNSSTVKPILLFIRLFEENSVSAKIIYDKNISWQKASFISLGIVTRSYQYVNVESK